MAAHARVAAVACAAVPLLGALPGSTGHVAVAERLLLAGQDVEIVVELDCGAEGQVEVHADRATCAARVTRLPVAPSACAGPQRIEIRAPVACAGAWSARLVVDRRVVATADFDVVDREELAGGFEAEALVAGVFRTANPLLRSGETGEARPDDCGVLALSREGRVTDALAVAEGAVPRWGDRQRLGIAVADGAAVLQVDASGRLGMERPIAGVDEVVPMGDGRALVRRGDAAWVSEASGRTSRLGEGVETVVGSVDGAVLAVAREKGRRVFLELGGSDRRFREAVPGWRYYVPAGSAGGDWYLTVTDDPTSGGAALVRVGADGGREVVAKSPGAICAAAASPDGSWTAWTTTAPARELR